MFSLPFDSKITGYDSNGIPQYDRASGSAEFARLLGGIPDQRRIWQRHVCRNGQNRHADGGERGQLRDRRAVGFAIVPRR